MKLNLHRVLQGMLHVGSKFGEAQNLLYVLRFHSHTVVTMRSAVYSRYLPIYRVHTCTDVSGSYCCICCTPELAILGHLCAP